MTVAYSVESLAESHAALRNESGSLHWHGAARGRARGARGRVVPCVVGTLGRGADGPLGAALRLLRFVRYHLATLPWGAHGKLVRLATSLA